MPEHHAKPNENTISQWRQDLADASPQTIVAFALEKFKHITISFSGAEDVALVQMAAKIKPNVSVFSLDTGRLHPETYQFIETIRNTYPIDLKISFPDPAAVSELTQQKGLFSFYQDGHKECCAIRKVAPLRIMLKHYNAWMTGQRQDQSPDTRQNVEVVQLDKAFSSPQKPLIKFNPLARWSSQQVWDYIRAEDIPYNPLHQQGFTSIGCAPCTKPVLPNQHEREGRWWWEEATQKECGLHVRTE